MALELPEWKVRAYAANVHHLASQMDSTLRGTTREETKTAERIGFDRLGPMEGETPNTRFAPTPNAQGDHTRRWVFPRPWRFGKLTESLEKIQQLHEPQNEYAVEGAASYNREWDRRIIAAALGAAVQGEETVISVPFDTTNQTLVHGGTALTRSKIVRARAKLDRATNSNRSMFGPYYFVYDPDDIQAMFDPTATGTAGGIGFTHGQWTSSDYINGQPLMEGKPLSYFMGFTWLPSTLLPMAGTIRSNIAYAKSGLGVGKNLAARKERVDERADLSYAAQIFMEDQFDCVRIDDKLVVEIQVDTSLYA